MSDEAPRTRRLIGLRLMCLDDDVPRAYVEYRIDAAGRAIAVAGDNTMAAVMYQRGACAPAGCGEAGIAANLAAHLGIAFEPGRLYAPEDGEQYLVCIYADNRPRTRTWAEAIVFEHGVERVLGARVIAPCYRVLVATVDRALSESITTALRGAGHAAIHAAIVMAARDILRRGDFHAIVADLHMAAIGDVAAIARSRASPVPIVLVAAGLTPDLRGRVLALGVASVHEAATLDLARLVADVEAAAARGAPPR